LLVFISDRRVCRHWLGQRKRFHRHTKFVSSRKREQREPAFEYPANRD
jgi:hypothetical protein